MSNNHPGDLKEQQHHPLRGFYAVPPAGLMLNHHPIENIASITTTSSSSYHKNIATATFVSKVTPTTAAQIYTAIAPTHRIIHYGSASPSHAIPSSITNISTNKMSPPLINNANDSSFNNKVNMNQENADELPWLAPLLGVLGTLGVVGVIILYLIGRKRKNRQHNNRSGGGGHQYPEQPHLSNSYQSWASLSTIHTSAATTNAENNGEKIIIPLEKQDPPPPAYTSVKQKRLTADTLVDENNISLMILKNQYSPQLAFSPSLVAGEFQQQQLEEEKPPLPNSLSPSNTLIDNAGILATKTENYHYSFDQRPKRIEIYEPQVNLHNDANPFIPYSYSNDQEQESEEQRQLPNHNNNNNSSNNDDQKQHHVVDMNHTSSDKS